MHVKRPINSQVVSLVVLGLLILFAAGVSANYERKTPAPSGMQGITRLETCSHFDLDASNCPSQPQALTVQILLQSSGAIVSEFTSAADGRYQVQLPPGKYIVQSRPDALHPFLKPEIVNVDAAKYENVDLLFDSQSQ